jgi:hypothetical protein
MSGLPKKRFVCWQRKQFYNISNRTTYQQYAKKYMWQRKRKQTKKSLTKILQNCPQFGWMSTPHVGTAQQSFQVVKCSLPNEQRTAASEEQQMSSLVCVKTFYLRSSFDPVDAKFQRSSLVQQQQQLVFVDVSLLFRF